jgi:3',5'-cyclic AMP phosphodiesterase CpdA
VRIVHLTDLHVQHLPTITDFRPKRIIGMVNLYLAGRRHHFNLDAQSAAIRAATALSPDLTLITGDLTAQGLDSEFEAVHALLEPLARSAPLYMIPGNHDLYVAENTPGSRMRAVLGEWMSPASPGIAHFGDVSALYIETCRPTWLSSGATDLSHLEAAEHLLKDARAFTFLCLHYPLIGRHGERYGPSRRANNHADAIDAWVRRQPQIGAILHGHEHHGFHATLPAAHGDIHVLNPGASGYAWLPQQDRTAHFNVYTVEDGSLTKIERYRWNGTDFHPEDGGAYATGR